MLFSQSISDKMYNLLLSESFSPLTQNLVSSGENDFNYNIIVEFDSKNLNDEKKVSNLIFIFNQEDFFYHDFLNNSLTNLSQENDFQKDNKNQVSNLQMTLNSNRQMILKLLSELRIQNFDFNLFFLFTTGEKQYPEKRDMIFGSQVFLERLNSNEDYTVFFINLNETKTKIICFIKRYTDSICRKDSYIDICKASAQATYVAGWGADTSGYRKRNFLYQVDFRRMSSFILKK